MPFHSVLPLPGGALLGRWHLLEPPAALWSLLAAADTYQPLLPARTQGPRQAQWLAGRVLVQRLLQTASPGQSLPPLLNSDTGRPYLAGAGQPAVSLSHGGEWVAALLAPAGTAVGIDVELVRDKAQRIQTKFLNDVELAAARQLEASTDPVLLYALLWSAKETLFKLAGRPGIIFRQNLLLDLPPTLPSAAGTLAARLHRDGRQSRHQICYFEPAPGYVLTYCVD